MTRIQDFATGMYMETKEMDDNPVIRRRLKNSNINNWKSVV